MIDVSELLGKVIIKIERDNGNDSEVISFYLSNGAIYQQYHTQDCCESVCIEDIDGDFNDLIGYPLLQAEESTQDDPNASESATWTFYRFATIKGYVTIRWYGESNGFYSESVEIHKVKDEYPIKEQRKKKIDKINGNKWK